MIQLILPFVIFILGLLILVKGSGIFVESSIRIAKHLGVSEFVIGLTLIAVGTSLPELSASLMATYSGNPEIVIGNVLGSNIANICLILGVSSLICVLEIKSDIFRRDTFALLGISLMFYIFALDLRIGKLDGLILLILFSVYIAFLFKFKPKLARIYKFKGYLNYLFKLRHKRIDREILRELLIVTFGIVAIFIGAKFLIDSTIDLASLLGIPKSIVALLLISFGTSLPELSVAVASAKRGFGNMILGNIIGSNIANISLILGLSALFTPIPISLLTIGYIIPFMLFTTLLCVLFIRSGWIIRMFEGFIFILLYIGFILWVFFQITP